APTEPARRLRRLIEICSPATFSSLSTTCFMSLCPCLSDEFLHACLSLAGHGIGDRRVRRTGLADLDQADHAHACMRQALVTVEALDIERYRQFLVDLPLPALGSLGLGLGNRLAVMSLVLRNEGDGVSRGHPEERRLELHCTPFRVLVQHEHLMIGGPCGRHRHCQGYHCREGSLHVL